MISLLPSSISWSVGTVASVANKLEELGVPFVFYTGQLKADEVFTEWPLHDVIEKPASPHTLAAAIRRLLFRP
jgi:hypothetical protein